MPDLEPLSTTRKSWWETLPGAITALGTLVTAVTGGVISVQHAVHPADAVQTQTITSLQQDNSRLKDENARLQTQVGPPTISWAGKNFDSASFSIDTCKARAANEGLKIGGVVVQQGDTWIELTAKGNMVIVECQAQKSGYVIVAGPNPLDPNMGGSLAQSIFP